ncbi:MAG: phosphoglycerate dehydrogenase [Gemmatimonadota bacterium]|nr:phosphoglycerate dehydrogenase [Gemmatimonadota bacterium]
MQALHIEPLPEWIRDLFERTAQQAGVEIIWGGELGGPELARAAERADALMTVMRPIDGDLIRAAGALRLVQVQGRAPWAVDVEAAAAAGVRVSMLPHRGAIAVAEQTIALMLGLYRKLVPGHLGTRNADYRDLEVEPVRTTERKIAFNWLRYPDVHQLHGRVLGLVGLGGIGLEVVRRARAFDMEVLYFKRSPLPREHERMAGVRYLPLHEMLAASDVVSLHAPHTEHTEHIIDSAALRAMKSDAILVNTARGGLVDEAALLDALKAGQIAGAGLDVFLDEPLPEDSPLRDAPNVLFSPHVGGGTGGGQAGMARDVVANLVAVSEEGAVRGLIAARTASS